MAYPVVRNAEELAALEGEMPGVSFDPDGNLHFEPTDQLNLIEEIMENGITYFRLMSGVNTPNPVRCSLQADLIHTLVISEPSPDMIRTAKRVMRNLTQLRIRGLDLQTTTATRFGENFRRVELFNCPNSAGVAARWRNYGYDVRVMPE